MKPLSDTLTLEELLDDQVIDLSVVFDGMNETDN